MSYKPGCFGLPSAISAASPTCVACEHNAVCVQAASALLASLPDTPNVARERKFFSVTVTAFARTPLGSVSTDPTPVVVASSRGVRRIPLTDKEQAHVASLPPRVGSQLKNLMERGWFDFAKREIRAGRNPASKGWKKVFCAALIAGNPSRAELRLALMEQLSLSPRSAEMQTSVGISLFAAGRLATERQGVLMLNPN